MVWNPSKEEVSVGNVHALAVPLKLELKVNIITYIYCLYCMPQAKKKKATKTYILNR